MTNLLHGNPNNGVKLALAVASGTTKGQVVIYGEGLKLLTLTDRATTATIAAGTAAQGLADGQASCLLLDVDVVVNLTIAGGTSAVGEKIYRVTADGTYSSNATSAVFIGYALDVVASGAVGRVALTAA